MEDPSGIDDMPEASGLYCFMSEVRPCGAECMAYVVHPADGPGELSPQQRHCALLTNFDRVGRFMGGLVSLKKKEYDDQKRPGTPPPPNPRGVT